MFWPLRYSMKESRHLAGRRWTGVLQGSFSVVKQREERQEILYILYFNIWCWTCWLAAKPKAFWDFWPNIFKYFLYVFSAASPDRTHPAGNECGFTRTHQHTVGWEPRMWEPRWPWARACLRMSVRQAYMPCCHKRSKVGSGVKMSSTEQDGIQTLQPRQAHVNACRQQKAVVPLICLRILVKSVIHLRTLGLAALSAWEGCREKSWHFTENINNS